MTTKSKVKKFNSEYKTKNQPVDTDIPLVVLVNGSSASASEIVSGSLQDLDRAVVMGARSFGKGLVQRPLKLTYGTQLKVTISRYYTPSGRCIQSLDYWNRDGDGNAVKTTDIHDFKTRNGRKVQDGGGVLPDVEITALKTNTLTKALLRENAIFDFATAYYYKNKVEDLSTYTFTDTDFEAFKNYIKSTGFSFETETEKALNKALNDSDLLDTNVQEKYRSLLAEINTKKITGLDTSKKEIVKQLEDEIVKRYFYNEGLYEYYLSHDEAILTASSLLADASKYKSILK